MKLKVGDRVVWNPDKDVIREIVEVRDTGYSWKYPDIDKTFLSENSNDPFFEMHWSLVHDGQSRDA